MIRAATAASLLVLATAAAADAQSFNSDKLYVKDVVGVITVETGVGDEIVVDIEGGGDFYELPKIHLDGDRVEILGRQRVRYSNCRTRNGEAEVRLRRRDDYRDLDAFARITVTAPEGLFLEISNGLMQADVGDLGGADIGLGGCADIRIGDINGPADLSINGSGDLYAGDIAGAADLAINGSGNLETGVIGGELDAAINGSGDIRLAGVNAATDVVIRGSGDVNLGTGRVPSLDVTVMGSGDVRLDGPAGDVDLTVMGSGDVYVSEVEGNTSKSILGSGNIVIGG